MENQSVMSDFEKSVMNDIYRWAAMKGFSFRVDEREIVYREYWKEYLGE